jgi:hypothetical protein
MEDDEEKEDGNNIPNWVVQASDLANDATTGEPVKMLQRTHWWSWSVLSDAKKNYDSDKEIMKLRSIC